MKNWAQSYSCKLMEAGIISYEDSGAGIAYLTKQTIDKIAPSLIGKPVVIRHQKVTPENQEKLAVGYVTGVHFNPQDAWHYVDFLLTSDKLEPIERDDGSVVFKAPDGEILDGISGAYDVTNTNDGGVWHDIKFDAEILDGAFTHLALVNNPRYEETNRITERMPHMLVNGKDAVMQNAMDNYIFTTNGERFRIYIKKHGEKFYCEAKDSSGAVVETTPDQNNEPEARYACESMLYLKTRNSKQNAKIVIIDIPFRLISEVGDKQGISDSQVEQKLRAKGLVSVGAGGGDATFEFEGTEQAAAEAVKSVLGSLRSVTIGMVNSKANGRAGVFHKGERVRDVDGVFCKIVGEAASGEYYVVEYSDGTHARMREADLNMENSKGDQAAFEKEKKEHPEFTDEQVWQIVRDHERKNSVLDDNQKAVLKWMDENNVGALAHDGKYRFKEEIRQDPNLARALKKYLDKPGKKNSGEEFIVKQNSKEAQMQNPFKIFKKLINGKEEEVADLAVDIDGKNVKVNDLIEAYKADEAEEAKKKANEKEAEEKRKKEEEEKEKENAKKNLRMAKDEDTVVINGKSVTIADLKNAVEKRNKKNASETDEEKAKREKAEKEKAENEKRNAEEKEKADKEATAALQEKLNSKKTSGEIFIANNSKLEVGAVIEHEAKHYNVTEPDTQDGKPGYWAKENAKKGEEFFMRIENAGKNAPQEQNTSGPMTRSERAQAGRERYGSKNQK